MINKKFKQYALLSAIALHVSLYITPKTMEENASKVLNSNTPKHEFIVVFPGKTRDYIPRSEVIWPKSKTIIPKDLAIRAFKDLRWVKSLKNEKNSETLKTALEDIFGIKLNDITDIDNHFVKINKIHYDSVNLNDNCVKSTPVIWEKSLIVTSNTVFDLKCQTNYSSKNKEYYLSLKEFYKILDRRSIFNPANWNRNQHGMATLFVISIGIISIGLYKYIKRNKRPTKKMNKEVIYKKKK